MSTLEQRLRDILRNDHGRMTALAAVAGLQLPQGAIGAGFIRTAVWDAMTGRGPSPCDDIDVIYFDPDNPGKEAEARIEQDLSALQPDRPWSVRNQARMYLRNGDAPYRSLAEALRHWLETPTCVAVRLTVDQEIDIVAPFGLDDLFAMRIRPTPRGRQRAADYRRRIETKDWARRWPEATIELP